jgi:two-component system sensor histidine kinase BaeS
VRPALPRSLTARVVGLVALVTLASSLLVGVALVRAQTEANLERASDTLALQADNLAGRLAAGRQLAVTVLVNRLTRQGLQVDVAGGGGTPPAPFTPDDVSSGRPGLEPVRREVGDVAWLVVARPVGDGRTVLLARRLAQAGGLTEPQRRRAALVVLGVLAVGVLGGLALAQGITRPLRGAAAAARRLTAGDRDVRVGTGGPSEVAEVGAALNGLAERLAESEERQRRFLLAVGHELRTPLTAVTGYAEALADGVLPAQEVPRAGAVVLAEARRLQHRVDDLMALARVQADDFALVPAVVDLPALVAAAAAAWRPRAQETGVPLRVEMADRPVRAWADGERVRQAVDALVDNALRVLPAGAPLVLATGSSADGRCWVQVRDGGPGLAPAELAVAFESGRLTERYRGDRPVGTGLGLALVAHLARRMGGEATAAPAPEGGVAFTLSLPAA